MLLQCAMNNSHDIACEMNETKKDKQQTTKLTCDNTKKVYAATATTTGGASTSISPSMSISIPSTPCCL